MSPSDPGTAADFLRQMAATLAAGTVDLPAFPHVVIKVQEILRNPNYSLRMIVGPISSDPTLAARLLNMANSTAFNATGRVIIDLGVALTRLGAQKVYSVVLAHAIQDLRRAESLQGIAREIEELWSDSVAVAHFCDAVAKRSSPPIADAFVAGLLHRVGQLYILVQCAHQKPPRPRIVLSRDLIEAWHPAIGKAILKNWHISDTVCEAVGAQREILGVRTGAATLDDVLIAGIRLANRWRNSYDPASLTSGGVLARLNLSMEECNRLIAEAAAEVRALGHVLHA
jgi:HD-like signal output (HDOD) protein